MVSMMELDESEDDYYDRLLEKADELNKETKERRMSAVVWLVKKYGQVTQVYVDGKLAYVSGNTVKAEAGNLRKLIEANTIENTVVQEEEK